MAQDASLLDEESKKWLEMKEINQSNKDWIDSFVYRLSMHELLNFYFHMY